jgi:hypothetical protein
MVKDQNRTSVLNGNNDPGPGKYLMLDSSSTVETYSCMAEIRYSGRHVISTADLRAKVN